MIRKIDHRGDEHDRVGDRRHRHDHEAPLGEEHRGGDRADRVEQHLGDEEAQEEGRQGHLLRLDLRVRARRSTAAGRSGWRSTIPITETTAMTASGQAEHPRRQALGLGVVAGPEQVDERGHEHRRERPGGDELEQHVRDRARGLVGVAQVGGAEDGGDHPDLDEADARGTRAWRRSSAPRPASVDRRSPPPSEQAYGARRAFSGGDAGMLAAGRPPGRRRPRWGDGPSGGGWASSRLGSGADVWCRL